MIFFLIFFTFLFLLDLYIFQGIKVLFKQKWIYWAYWILNIAWSSYLIYLISKFSQDADADREKFVVFGRMFFIYLIPKFFFILVLLGEDIFRLLKGLILWIGEKLSINSTPEKYIDGRRKFMSQIAVLAAGIPFASILYGMTKGKYNYKVWRKTLYFPDLPDAFDGFTLTQISDVHSGSFDDFENVKKGIDLINEQQSDVILFTGDLVNSQSKEMEPWKDLFGTLKAPLGKYSILGNHDYGDYVHWKSEEEKVANLNRLAEIQKEMGFRLLLDENLEILKGNDKIKLIGVQNWSKTFKKYGNLNKAMEGVSDQDFKILMSHDPTHWEAEILPHPQKIHLTLSGHTHGLQFGVENNLFRFSPAKFIYKQWAGLYEKFEQKIYVNRGFGFLFFPGRVGIWPEITVLTLTNKKTA